MSILLFKLVSVPDDEAQDIRDLLHANDIAFYETSAGILGFSMPGIWLQDDAQLVQARQLIDQYQKQREGLAREDYLNRQAAGRSRTIYDMFRESPRRFIAYLLTIATMIYLSVVLFFNLI
jgi:hypothetical protein